MHDASLSKKIDEYVSYFQNHLLFIDEYYSKSRIGEIHSKILYMSLIDAIAHSVYPDLQPRQRVLHFVKTFCDWPDGTRISLPHLKRLVGAERDPSYKSLKNYVIRQMSDWQWADCIDIFREPDIEDVREYWPKNKEKIAGVRIESLTHLKLLYNQRNSLVHELRQLGKHAELFDRDEPYYTTVFFYKGDLSERNIRFWELQYPAKFLRKLCSNGLLNLKKYLIENETDPYESINWGHYWIKELNENVGFEKGHGYFQE